jgi:hypothetical protein
LGDSKKRTVKKQSPHEIGLKKIAEKPGKPRISWMAGITRASLEKPKAKRARSSICKARCLVNIQAFNYSPSASAKGVWEEVISQDYVSVEN